MEGEFVYLFSTPAARKATNSIPFAATPPPVAGLMVPVDLSMLQGAAQTVPPGRWGVGVSGGADSVGLLALLRQRTDLSLHVIHLNHELRGAESDADGDFVTRLCEE